MTNTQGIESFDAYAFACNHAEKAIISIQMRAIARACEDMPLGEIAFNALKMMKII